MIFHIFMLTVFNYCMYFQVLILKIENLKICSKKRNVHTNFFTWQ